MEVILLVILALIIFGLIIYYKYGGNCKPNCSGAFCGSNSSDGCGGTCNCKENGKCNNGVCCYPNCNGLKWGDDGCGGTCSCDIIPGGKEMEGGKCCYAQDCNNVYCGPDGCGGTCGCQSGSTCSSSGICSNSGTPGYIYNILDSNGIERTNVSSPLECSSWMPENVVLNLTAFPCSSDSDCPYDDTCVVDPVSKKKFCNRNDVYQFWYYDPTDPSGYNCTKIRQGSTVCSLPKEGAFAFDIAGNKGADVVKCSDTCVINPECPSSGKGSCCPGNWAQKNSTSSYCIDTSGQTQCCLNNPDLSDYNDCIGSGKPSCEKAPNAWWKGNLGEIGNGVCGMKVTGSNISINQETLQKSEFSSACETKNAGDPCTYEDGSTTFEGLCKSCSDGSLKCLPDVMCSRIFLSSNQPGMCSTKNVCIF